MSKVKLAVSEDSGAIVACAGFRVREWRVSGKVLHVDDLETKESVRSKNYGKKLPDWRKSLAKKEDRARLRLGSGTNQTVAHKFYFRQSLPLRACHFEANP
ncbi:GNAT family N-acetyltransferase [Asticcacaulis sp. AC402]|uniref:GNAT family N-acetyltransferase n=1 Tax=Asticcacaulis sp. AC402 TaxID=1282361 RepID=UPI0003C3AEFA|nr:GNAT family N-acetyltransferase [Asticcacaulis sp. AC402]ESQ75450.1 hypothetical protein ABAC402_10140 [Asticcacaulis sp. AC402]